MIQYHYILTIQWGDSRGRPNFGTFSGAQDFSGRMTDQEIYAVVFNAACDKFRAPKDGSAAIFYRLARNEA